MKVSDTSNLPIFAMFTPLQNLPEGRKWTLDDLNEREVQLLIPVIIFMSTAMVVGIVGNALVLYVNIVVLKLRNSTHRYFTTFLALVDITFCMICDPFMIGDLTHPYTFTNTLACKSLRACAYFNALVSALVIFVIALDRYRRICRPFGNQFSIRSMKLIFGIIVLISVIFSIPSLILYGKNTVQTGIANITGIQCFPDDMYKGTLFPNGYIIFLYALFIIATAGMSVFYTLVWRQLRKQTSSITTSVSSDTIESNVCTCTTDIYSTEMVSVRSTAQTQHNTHEDPKSAGDTGKYINEGKKENKDKRHTDRERSIRVSKILLVVTTFFVLSFAPYLSLELLTYFKKKLIDDLNNTSTILYQLFFRSYAINFMVNPFIYGVMDRRFQMECKKLVLKRLQI